MKIIVEAGNHSRHACPVTALIPEKGTFVLKNELGAAVPAGNEETAEGTKLTFVVDTLRRGETAVYTVEKAGAVCTCCTSKDDGEQVQVTLHGLPYTVYYHGAKTVKPYLGPIFGRYGEQITRLNFEEKEHVHHRSIWFSHGSVNGVDTWNEPAGKHGRILNHGLDGFFSGPVSTGFTARNTWTDFDSRPLCEDVTKLTFYDTPDRLIDVEITLTAAYGKVVLGSTKEAGPIAVRMNYNLTVANTGTMENAYGGINEDEIWMKRSPWCDYYGTEAGHVTGIAILDNPENERHPAYWHSRNYGLMAPNNFYLGGDRVIAEGESVTFRYRLVAHEGDTREADIAGKFHDYANPPKVTVEA